MILRNIRSARNNSINNTPSHQRTNCVRAFLFACFFCHSPAVCTSLFLHTYPQCREGSHNSRIQNSRLSVCCLLHVFRSRGDARLIYIRVACLKIWSCIVSAIWESDPASCQQNAISNSRVYLTTLRFACHTASFLPERMLSSVAEHASLNAITSSYVQVWLSTLFWVTNCLTLMCGHEPPHNIFC